MCFCVSHIDQCLWVGSIGAYGRRGKRDIKNQLCLRFRNNLESSPLLQLCYKIVKKLIGVSDEAFAGIFGINSAFHKDFMCRIHERRHWEYEPALRELRLNGRRAAYFFGYIAYQVGNGTIKNLI